jgi:drug/metabolite transporter (DMT)-like permease
MVLNFTWPVTLTILSILFLKQLINWKSLLAILISFIGIIVIATQGNPLVLKFTNPAGVMLALGSTVIWSSYWIINIKDKRDEVVKLFLNFVFGFIYILITSIVMNILVIPNWKAIAGSVYIGLFEMGIAYVFWLKGLQLSTTTAKVSNLIFMAPFVSLILINVFVGEPILWSTFAGLGFITVGILVQRRA